MADTAAPTPTLQPSGAGLPWWELLLVRCLFALGCYWMNWAAAARLFQAEGARVLAVWDALPADRLGERVLIRRVPGIEDSSRFWSAAMTVEHLNAVGTGVRQLIGSLRQGEVPTGVVRIVDYKPRGEGTPVELRAEFARLLADAADAEPPVPRGVGPRCAHPWFGPLDAHRWHCLLALHQRIHRRQMEAIRRGLNVA